MTIPIPPSNEDMRSLLLQFLGAFAHLQTMIDHFVLKPFLRKRMPKAASVVWKRVVTRVGDEEWKDLFKAIAREIGGDAELDQFGQV